MLRTTLAYVFGVCIAFAILVVSLFAVTFRTGRVRGAVLEQPSPTVVVVPTATPVNYPLPYPGLLPDSPFWFLKAMRDQVILFLTWDPIAKGKDELQLADKRLAAAEALINGGKITMGVSTAIKGETYFSEAIALLGSKGAIGAEVKTALAKHEEIIKELKSRSPELNNLLKPAVEIDQTIANIVK